MKSSRLRFFAILPLVLATILAVLPAPGAAQQTSAENKKMQEMMMKYAMPGKNHELLKNYAGDWDVAIKGWMKPGDEPMMSTATQKAALIFDGRYVKCNFEGTMGGRKFSGLEIIGYDLFQNKYTTLWIDNMSTSFLVTTGVLDMSGKVLTDSGMAPDPMTGKLQKVKNVTTFMEDGKYKFEMYMAGPDGKEFKSMELIATRKPKM